MEPLGTPAGAEIAAPLAVRALTPADRAEADPMLGALLGSEALGGLWTAVAFGRFALEGAWRDGALQGGWLLYADGTHRVAAGRFGAPDAAADRAIAAALQGRARTMLVPDEVLPEAAQALAPLGFAPFQRQTFIQGQHLLARPAEVPAAPARFRIAPWTPADAEAALGLMAAANAFSLDGAFLAWPDAPSEQACLKALRAALAGGSGPFLPEASFMAWEGPALAGALLALRSAPQQVTLFELAVAPFARGSGLGRTLVGHLQAALRRSGDTEIAFLTTGTNTPVHRLFRPEEIVRQEQLGGAVWAAR